MKLILKEIKLYEFLYGDPVVRYRGQVWDNLATIGLLREGVKKALFNMHPEKAPGPDGMTTLFYQKFWNVVKNDLVKMVRKFHECGAFDERLNEANICLIPKKERLTKMQEFRPIRLCNVSYKIISKILCFRLKRLLPCLISET